MSSEWIIGALAFVTIGIVAIIAISHFGGQLRDSRNKGAAKNILADGKSATTRTHEEAPEGSYHDRPLKQRLDASHASAHPHDPVIENRPKSS